MLLKSSKRQLRWYLGLQLMVILKVPCMGRLALDIMVIDKDSKLKITLHMHILTNINEFRMLPSHLINHLLPIQL